jgi:hypothetical protein
MVKKMAKDMLGFGAVTAGLGVTTAAVARMGGSTAGLSTMSGFMPIVGTVIMGKHVLRQTKKLKYYGR